MTSYRLVKIESLPGGLTEEILKEHESLSEVEGERQLAKSRLKFLSEQAELGLFNRCEWARCRCKEDGKDYRVNGNHSKTVLRKILEGELEAEFPGGIPVSVAWYECDSKGGLVDVFRQFDTHRSVRSPEDHLGVFAAQHSDLIGIEMKRLGKILSGVHWAAQHVPEVREICSDLVVDSAHDRGRYLYVDQVREFADLLHEHWTASFMEWTGKSGIIASMFSMFLKSPENCELAVEQTIHEVGNEAEKFAKSIRSACGRTGKEQGWYYRAADRHFKALAKMQDELGTKAIKKLIHEVLAEQDEDIKAVAV